MRGMGNVYLGDPVQDSAGNFVYSRLTINTVQLQPRTVATPYYQTVWNIGFQLTTIPKAGWPLRRITPMLIQLTTSALPSSESNAFPSKALVTSDI